MLENSMVIGPYYPDPPRPRDDDADYERMMEREEQDAMRETLVITPAQCVALAEMSERIGETR
jgi:hypothetical protein